MKTPQTTTMKAPPASFGTESRRRRHRRATRRGRRRRAPRMSRKAPDRTTIVPPIAFLPKGVVPNLRRFVAWDTGTMAFEAGDEYSVRSNTFSPPAVRPLSSLYPDAKQWLLDHVYVEVVRERRGVTHVATIGLGKVPRTDRAFVQMPDRRARDFMRPHSSAWRKLLPTLLKRLAPHADGDGVDDLWRRVNTDAEFVRLSNHPHCNNREVVHALGKNLGKNLGNNFGNQVDQGRRWPKDLVRDVSENAAAKTLPMCVHSLVGERRSESGAESVLYYRGHRIDGGIGIDWNARATGKLEQGRADFLNAFVRTSSTVIHVLTPKPAPDVAAAHKIVFPPSVLQYSLLGYDVSSKLLNLLSPRRRRRGPSALNCWSFVEHFIEDPEVLMKLVDRSTSAEE